MKSKIAIDVAATLIASALTLVTAMASAQDGTQPSSTSPTGSTAAGAATGSAGVNGVGAGAGVSTGNSYEKTAGQMAAKSASDDGSLTDHDRVVGRFAVGFMGLTDLPLPVIGQVAIVAPNSTPQLPTKGAGTLVAPVIGARYWFNSRFGIDAGLGIGWNGGSGEAVVGSTTTVVEKSARFGFILHGGVPVALVTSKHFTFEVIPEFNVGYATTAARAQTTAPNQNAGPDATASAFRLDIGARVGGEIHFGFIGVPQLALQGTVGLAFQTVSSNVKRESQSISESDFSLATSVQADPWALFTRNISALYYF